MTAYSTRILIIEDDEHQARMYTKMLNYAGFDTFCAATIEAAIQAISTYKPDIVCLDWHIRKHTGADFLDYIAQIPLQQRPSIVVVSGKSERDEFADYDTLITDILEKPIDMDKYIQVLQTIARIKKPARVTDGL